MPNTLNITATLATQLIHDQFPEFSHLPVTPVQQQGHDNRTYRLGEDKLIRLPTEEVYALAVQKEQALLPLIKPYITTPIPTPIAVGKPTQEFPFHFSIYHWLRGDSANQLTLDNSTLENIATQLAQFLKELHGITNVKGPAPGQHNWWRGDHVSVYDKAARQQMHQLSNIIDTKKAIALWDKACDSPWNSTPVWLHGDVASGNILIKDNQLAAVIDFGGMAVGDPACDLVIAWTLFHGKSRAIFVDAMAMDSETWLRAKAWCLWKSTFEVCQIEHKNSDEAVTYINIINAVLA